jgi:hypothetical protein
MSVLAIIPVRASPSGFDISSVISLHWNVVKTRVQYSDDFRTNANSPAFIHF